MVPIITSIKPFLAVLTSVAGVFLIIAFRKRRNLREASTFLAALVKFGIVASMVPVVLDGHVIDWTIAEVLPNIPIKLRVDAFGLLFALVSSSLWIITSVYSVGYMRGLSEHSQTRYFCFFALSLSATIGVSFSANLLTMYLFYEMLSFATYPLVTHHQDPEAQSSGRKYLFYILGSSVGFVLPAMVVTYLCTGTLDFTAQGVASGNMTIQTGLALTLMFVFGFAKSGIMPLHSWLPAAMVAPTPVSALLHAVAVVKVGAFCIFRVLTGIFGAGFLSDADIGGIVCAVAAFTILISSLIAMSQDELKRRLAFSTIGQLSYIILGAALLTPSGMTGGMLHIAMHAFGKITLFFCAGAIYVSTRIKHISGMTGIGKRMPVTMTAFFIGALSVIGLPPCGGFIGKWYLLLGTVEGARYAMLVVLLASSLLNAAYFLPIVYKAFFCAPGESLFTEGIQEAPIWCLVPPVATALISICLFFYPQPFLGLAKLAVKSILGGG